MEGGDVLRRAATIALRLSQAHDKAIKADLPTPFLIATADAKQQSAGILDALVLRYLQGLGRVASRN